eukprot:30103-Chlamydomonas_euryale.AAC.2
MVLTQIIQQEPLISENRRPALRQLVERLVAKMMEQQHHSFTLFKVCVNACLTSSLHVHASAQLMAQIGQWEAVMQRAWWCLAGPAHEPHGAPCCTRHQAMLLEALKGGAARII